MYFSAASRGNELRHSWHHAFEEVRWDARSWITVVLTFTVSALANAGGVGGGGFLVPLFNLVLGLSLKGAMALSQAAMTGGAVAAGIFAMFTSHPLDSSKPLLDLDMALVVMPCLLLGVSLGVTLNQIFPDWLLVILLSIMLVLLSVRTLQSGIRLHRKEVASRNEDEEEDSDSQDMLLAASSEVPNLQSGRSGRMSLERRRSGRQSLEAQRLLSAHSHTAPKLPLLAIQQAESEGSREASEVDGALPSHRVQFDRSESGLSSDSESPKEEGKDLLKPNSLPVEADGISQLLQVQADSRIEEQRHQPSPSSSHGDAGKEKAGETKDGEESGPQRSAFQEASQLLSSNVQRQSLWTRLREFSKLLLLILIWAAYLTLQVFKDSFYTCSRGYFILYGAQGGFCILATTACMVGWMNFHSRSRRDEEQPLLESAISPATHPHHDHGAVGLAISALAILLGGCIASLCGLGGGMILGPVMLELGLHPLVTASTSLLLVGASSSSATVGFALADRLDYGWAIIMFVLCVVASTVGVAGIGKIVRRSGKASLIVFLLVFIMFAGGLLTAVFGGIHAVSNLHEGHRAGFLNICKS